LARMRGPFPLLRAKFHPHRCNDKGVGPQKLKFLLRFDQYVEYKRPAVAYPSRDFHKTCRVCTSFQDALGVKILLDLFKGLWSYGGFKLRGLVTPKFSAPLAAKLCVRPKSFGGTRTCSRSSIAVPSLVGLGFHPLPAWPKTLSFFTGSIARSAACRYLIYSEADFEVSRLGATRCTDGVKYAKFHPHRCNGKGVGPPKLKFFPDLTKMWNINAPQGRIPFAIFTKFAESVPHFRMR